MSVFGGVAAGSSEGVAVEDGGEDAAGMSEQTSQTRSQKAKASASKPKPKPPARSGLYVSLLDLLSISLCTLDHAPSALTLCSHQVSLSLLSQSLSFSLSRQA